jgi:hypothetical protein
MGRKLYYVPIIHTIGDMGSVAVALDEGAIEALGPKLWQRHRETIAGFWESIARFFDSLDVDAFKIYQDGLVAAGTAGKRIVQESIKQGSKNYEIIGSLLSKGARLVKTEDLTLIKQEYAHIMNITRASSDKAKMTQAARYKRAKSGLLKKRDEYIARRINDTLNEGETGVLFIGAYHDLLPKLPDDIQIEKIKDPAKVKAYHEELLSMKKDSQRFLQLAEHLTAPVTVM